MQTGREGKETHRWARTTVSAVERGWGGCEGMLLARQEPSPTPKCCLLLTNTPLSFRLHRHRYRFIIQKVQHNRVCV